MTDALLGLAAASLMLAVLWPIARRYGWIRFSPIDEEERDS